MFNKFNNRSSPRRGHEIMLCTLCGFQMYLQPRVSHPITTAYVHINMHVEDSDLPGAPIFPDWNF